MRILVSNDDGIYSPGIAVLAGIASEFGDVCVVAPDVERSSAGHSITASRPLSYRPTRLEGLTAYRVNGTPADCVSIGVYHWEKVDIVLSGLNLGFNLGNSIWHSGTVAAAKQAALLGLRGVAFSAPAGAESIADFEPLRPWIRQVLQTLLAEGELPLVNVNFPRHPRGVIWTRSSVRRYDGKIVPTARSRWPQGVLVHRHADRRRGGGYRSLGHRTGLDINDTLASRLDRRTLARRGASTASARRGARGSGVAREIVSAGRTIGPRRRSPCRDSESHRRGIY